MQLNRTEMHVHKQKTKNNKEPTNFYIYEKQMPNRNAHTQTQNQPTFTTMHTLSTVLSYSYTELTDSF